MTESQTADMQASSKAKKVSIQERSILVGCLSDKMSNKMSGF